MRKFKGLFFGLIAVLCLKTTSCQVGLGSAVDTQVPTLKIEYPAENGLVIRDWFYLSGSCKDDTKIVSITIDVKGDDSSNNNIKDTIHAELSDDAKKWYAKINLPEEEQDEHTRAVSKFYNGWSYPDGTYTLTVTAEDDSGKTTVLSRTVQIDNTAPVMVVTSPNNFDISSFPCEYGSLFSIKGNIGEKHEVSKMSVKVFDNHGNEIAGSDRDVTDIAKSGTSAEFGRFGDEFYGTIYGNTKQGTKYYSCSVWLTDNAKAYQDRNFKTFSDGEGNKTSKIFMNDEIYADFLQSSKYENGETKTIQSYSYDELAELLNETISDSKIKETANRTKLLGLYRDTTEYKTPEDPLSESHRMAFCINPDANPKYTVLGSSINEDGTYIDGNSGQAFSVQLSAGRNGTLIQPSSIKVWVFGPYEQLEGTNELYDSIYKNPAEYYRANPSKIAKIIKNEEVVGEAIYSNADYSGGTVETYLFTQYLPKLESGKLYVIAAYGEDQDGVEAFNAKDENEKDVYYVLKGATSMAAPSLTMTYPNRVGQKYMKSTPKEIKGTYSSENNITKFKYNIKVEDLSGNIVGELSEDITLADRYIEDGVQWWKIDLTKDPNFNNVNLTEDSGKIYIYTVNVEITATAQETELSTSREVEVTVDAKAPEIEVDADPVYGTDTDDVKLINGIVKFVANIDEDFKNNTIYYYNTDGSSNWEEYSNFTTLTASQIVDTVKLNILSNSPDGNTEFYFKVVSSDKAGNSSEIINHYRIKQETDRPVITTSDAKDSSVITSFAQVTDSDNNVYTTKAKSINFNISDDDGIASVEIICKDENGNRVESACKTIAGNNRTTINYNYVLPDATGKYTVEVNAVDNKKTECDGIEGHEAYAKFHTNNTAKYFVIVDDGEPKISVGDGGYKSQNTSFNVEVKIYKDSSGEVKLYRKRGDAAPELIHSCESSQYAYVPFFDTLTSGTSGETIIYYTVDKYGFVSSNAEYTYTVDSVPPYALKVTPEAGKWYNTKLIDLEVFATDSYDKTNDVILDATSSTGINSVTYKIGDGEEKELSFRENVNKTAGTKEVSFGRYVASMIFENEGTSNVSVIVTDKVNNTYDGALKNFAFNIDTVAPEITSFTATNTKVNKKAVTNIASTPITLTVAASDATSGIEKIEFKEGAVVLQSGNKTSYDLTAANLSEEGTHNYTVTVEDKAGNKSTSTCSIAVDKTDPVVAVSVSPVVKMEDDSEAVNGTVSVIITVDEANKNITEYSITDGIKTVQGDFENLREVISVDTTTFADTKNLVISVVSKDQNLNEGTASYTIKINQDSDRPVVTVSNAKDSSIITNADAVNAESNLFNDSSNNKLNISLTDDDGLSGTVKFTVTNLATGTSKTETKTCKTTTSDSLAYTLPAAEGAYKVTIEVQDKLYASATDKTYHVNNLSEYYVVVDSGKPDLRITEPSSTLLASGQAFDVKGTTKDSSGVVAIKRYTNSAGTAGEKVIATFNDASTEKSWTDHFATTNDDGATYYYFAEDKFGQKTSEVFRYTVDTVRPYFIDTGVTSGTWYNSKFVPFNVQVTDLYDSVHDSLVESAASSGLKEVIYQIGDGEEINLKAGASQAIATGASLTNVTYTKYSGTMEFAAEGANNVNVIVRDNAGYNVYILKDCVYKIDTVHPVIENFAANVLAVNSTNIENEIYLSAKITDATSGIEEVILRDNENVKTITPTIVNNVYKYVLTKADLTTGTHAWSLEVKDRAGNISSAEVRITVDVTLPIVNVNGVTPTVTETSGASTINTVNWLVTFSGNVTDETKLNALLWNVDGDTTTEGLSGECTIAKSLYSEWRIEDFDTTKLADGDHVLNLTVQDSSQNEGTNTYSFTVDQSKDKPVITLENITAGLTEENQVTIASGNVLNYGDSIVISYSDDDGLASVTGRIVLLNDSLEETETAFDLPNSISSGTPKSHKYEHLITTTVHDGSVAIPEGIYRGTLVAVDDHNVKTTISTLFVIDRGAPVLTADTDFDWLKKNDKLSLSGSFTDGSGKVTLQAAYSNGETEGTFAASKSLSYDSVNKKYVFSDLLSLDSVLDSTSSNDKKVIRYTATDRWGNASSFTVSYLKDWTVPVIKDSSAYIGKETNLTAAVIATKWFKDSTQSIGGEITEAQSGVETVYYWINPSAGSSVVLGDYEKTSGTIAVTNRSGIARFKASLENLTAGTNSVYLVAKDAAGNYSAQASYTVRVDNRAPSIVKDAAILDSTLSNKQKAITFAGTVADNAGESGVASTDGVVLQIGDGDSSYTQSATVNNGEWTVTVPESAFAAITEDTVEVNAISKDVAGNEKSFFITRISFDTTVPSISLNSKFNDYTKASSPSSINGKHVLMGSVSEASPAKLELYWSNANANGTSADVIPTGSSSTWTKFYSATNASEIFNWTANEFDFSTNIGSGATGTVYILPVVYDTAGNCNIHAEGGILPDFRQISKYTWKFNVDKNTDRPVIKFNELEGDGSTDASTTMRKYVTNITGVITDDDGIDVVKISPTAKTSSSAWNSYSQPAGTLELTSGSFVYTPENSSDGTKDIYFYIKDTEGTEFWTNSSSALTRPFVKFKNAEENVSNNSVIKYKTDQNPPAIDYKKYAAFPGTTAPSNDTISALLNAGAFADMPSTTLLGGTKKRWVVFRVSVNDATSGIIDVSASFGEGKNITFNFTGNSSANGNGIWQSVPYDTYLLGSGNYTMNLTVTDGSGITVTQQPLVRADFDLPVVAVSTPAEDDLTTGEITVSGSITDISSITKVLYKVPKDDDVESDILNSFKNTSAQSNVHYTSSSFVIDLDGANALPAEYSELLEYENCTSDHKIYNFPIWIYVEDEFGNAKLYKERDILFNPYGDRPETYLLYPTNGLTMAEDIRVSGSAIDNTKVGKVYIQIDMNRDGKFTDADKAILEVMNDPKYVVVTQDEISGGNFEAHTIEDSENDWWGLEAQGTASWSYTINTGNALAIDSTLDSGTTDSDKVYKLSLRACSFDENNKLGNWTDKIDIYLDKNAPKFSDSPYIASADGTGRKSALDSDVWLKDEKYLYTSIYHTSGIKQISYKIGDAEAQTILTESGKITGKEAYITSNISDRKTVSIKIPLGTSTGSGSSTISITAIENDQSRSSKVEYSYSWDNAAPKIVTSDDVDGEDEGALSANGTPLNLTESNRTILENSNNQLVLGGAVEDADGGSGFSKLVFYFYRKLSGDANGKILDVMVDNSKDSSLAIIDTADYISLGEAGKTQKLYGYKPTATVDTTDDTNKTVRFSSYNLHVRAGALVKVNGIWTTISSITYDNDENPTATTVVLKDSVGGTTIDSNGLFIAYAQVVDNTSTEKVRTFNLTQCVFTRGDDGDGMPETITGSISRKIWDATVHANFISDGPADFVAFAFDKADNISAIQVPVSVQTNRPRLAKVHLGTDLSRDGKFEDSEFETYDIESANGLLAEVYELTTKEFGYAEGLTTKKRKQFKARNKLAIVPEFSGGNGTIGVAFDNAGSTADAEDDNDKKVTFANATKYKASPDTNVLKSTNTKITSSNVYVFENADLGSQDEHTVSFTFWDSTAGTTHGTDSQWSFLSVKDIKISTEDSYKPNVYINDFFWNSKEANSVAWNSSNEALGHIELISDISSTKTPDLVTTFGADDPKVSGKIIVRGTAYDDSILSGLYVQFGGNNSTSSKVTGDTTFTDVTPQLKKIATFADGTWTTVSTISGYSIKVYGTGGQTMTNAYAQKYFGLDENATADELCYLSQEGHRVAWELTIDTDVGGNVVEKDLILYVKASDQCSTPKLTDNTDVTNGTTLTGEAKTRYLDNPASVLNRSKYKMDVVPYITKVTTKLSSLKVNNPSVYARTARGHYPVASNETVTLSGFNLAASNADVTKAISEITTSGKFVWTVNGIDSINNMNSNDAYGTAPVTTDSANVTDKVALLGQSNYKTYAYNRVPNDDNNNLLTDDIEFDIWEMKNAARPISGVISDPIMKINPATGQLGFAFTNGPLYFSMPGTITNAENNRNAAGENSYAYWQGSYDFLSSIGLHYDATGHTYGCAAGGDINTSQADRFGLMTDRWGVGDAGKDGSYQGKNCLRLEAIGQYGDRKGNNTGTLNFDKLRVQSPSFASRRVNNSTDLFMAYFDELNGEIRFRYGNLDDTKTTKNSLDNTLLQRIGYTNYNGRSFGQFIDEYANTNSNANFNANNNINNGKYDTTYKQVIADEDGVGIGYSGQYVDIDIDKNGYIVLVWYDSTNGNLMYSYNTTPTTTRNGVNSTGWIKPTEPLVKGAGEYCKIACDKNGGVHIAAYNGNNGDLIYAYAPSYNGTFTTCVVDSYAITGQNITLEVGMKSFKINDETISYPIPYIGYYSLSSVKPKIAYIADPVSFYSGTITDGSVEDAVTGIWEISLIPTSSKAPQDRVNVGIWKDGNGNVVANTNTGTNSLNQYYGKSYGNATANPILGYQIRKSSTEGFIETAQMR